jgi:hypothetical protein
MNRRALPGAALLAVAVGLLAVPARGEEPAADGWRPFTATWTLSGERTVLPTGGDRPASIVHLIGPLTLTSGEGLGRGLLGEVIGFDDGGKLLAGRAVFTDEHGARIFCTVSAEPIGTGRLATATITGGTGGFAGLEGRFTLAWQYVLDTEGGQISGRAVNVEGRTRRGQSTRGQGGAP